ncbi:MAG: hypothetical protein JWQ49_309 [Edaphobacter sp.]|nr:hypothetical protein [Edaphobacter sp.]
MGRFPSQVMLSDEAFLRLLTSIRIERAGTVAGARVTYEAAVDPDGPFPKLDDLIEAGWVRVFRGRVVLPVEALRASKIGLTQNAAAYASVQERQYDVKYSFQQPVDSELDEAMRSLETGALTLHVISSERPGWVVARLWEELRSRFPDALEALGYWLDIRQEIGMPSVVPTEVWDKKTIEAFHSLALEYLRSAAVVGWNGIINQLARQMANFSNVETDIARSYFLPVPETICGRYLWLTSTRHERGFHSAIWTLEPLAVLISDLVADVERADLSTAPHPLFDNLMTIVEERPELMFIFNLSLHSRPLLLADLLLRPATSAWACLIIWQWQLRRDAWENNALRQDDDRNKSAAFADAVSILRYLMDEKGAPPAEAAELLAAVFRYERATGDTPVESSNAVRELFLEELTRAKTENILEILKALFGSASKEGPGAGSFDAALALVEASHLVAIVNPFPLVSSYIESMSRDDFGISAHHISATQAGVLYELATRGGRELQSRFLDPLNASERLSARSAPDANPFMIADSVAKTLRVHIQSEVAELRKELVELQSRVPRPSDPATRIDPDDARRLVEESKNIRGRIGRVERKASTSATTVNSLRFTEQVELAEEILANYGTALDKSQLAAYKRELERLGTRGDDKAIGRVTEEVEQLRWRVLLEQDWYWVEILDGLDDPTAQYSDRTAANDAIQRGRIAAAQGDGQTLREAVRSLWKLQPVSASEELRERSIDSGLRRF